MISSLESQNSALAPKLSAPQHKPRPLPLFLEMLRRETAAEPARMQQALAGLRRYQEAERSPPMPPMPVIAEKLGATLRDYGGAGAPVLFVPSLINPPNILDLSEDRSLLRWLAKRGHRVLLLDWGTDVERRRSLSIGGHVETILLPLMEALGEPPALVGYCLGGVMTVAAAALAPARSLTTIATPWDFAGYPDEARAMLAKLWAEAEPGVGQLGSLPMEVMQAAFWSLDPARTVAKFEAFADAGSDEERSFVTLEDWANDGPPLPGAAARELFLDMFRNDLTGRSDWQCGASVIDPDALRCPIFNLVSTVDRIVPRAASFHRGQTTEVAMGHVGMIVGSKAKDAVWEPLSSWLAAGGAN